MSQTRWDSDSNQVPFISLSEAEVIAIVNRALSSNAARTSTYKFAFFKAILDNIFNVDVDTMFLSYDSIAFRFTEIYWNLVLKYRLKQMVSITSGKITSVEHELYNFCDKYNFEYTEKSSIFPFESQLFKLFIDAQHAAEATSLFVHYKDNVFTDCRYPLTGTGDVNMYALFAELMRSLSQNGNAGFIVPCGIATDDSTKAYFAQIATIKTSLKCLYDFENSEGFFPNVHRSFKFSLVTLTPDSGISDFAFFLHNMSDLEDKRRHFTMYPEDFNLVNPNTHTCPVFRSEEDAKLAKEIYRKAGVFVREGTDDGNPWGVSFQRMYDMSLDSNIFSSKNGTGNDGHELLPLYEAKMMHQMDHRWNTFIGGKPVDVTQEEKEDANYSVTPEYWVPYTETILRTTTLDSTVIPYLRDALSKPEAKTIQKLREVCKKIATTKLVEGNKDAYAQWEQYANDKECANTLWKEAEKQRPKYLLGWRDITNATNERTTISTVIPFCGANHKFLLFKFPQTISVLEIACFLANLDSIVLDYFARQKVGGTDLTYTYLRQFPILAKDIYSTNLQYIITPKVMALTYSANDMVEWAKALWNAANLKMRLAMVNLNLWFTDGKLGSIIDEKFVDRDFDPAFLPPYKYSDEKRAILRAELDAYYARLYGLTRTELQYILDPQSVMGEDYPSETFRVLKDNEISKYGEYRTQRLVLEAWDRMERR